METFVINKDTETRTDYELGLTLGQLRITSSKELEPLDNGRWRKEKILYEFPLYGNRQGCLTVGLLPVNSAWSAGLVGTVTVTEEALTRHRAKDWNPNQIKKEVKFEVEKLNNHLAGELYEVVIFGSEGEWLDDSRGFYDREACREFIREQYPNAKELRT